MVDHKDFNLVVAVVVGHIDCDQVLQDMGFEQQLVNHNLAELEVDHIVADAAAAVSVVVVDTTLAYTAVEIDHMDFELEADHIADSELELDHIVVVVATAIREEVLGHLVDHCFD